MAELLAQFSLSLEPWKNAKERFLDSLPDEADKTLFKTATLENVFYSSSASFKHHESNSKVAKARQRLRPLLDSLDGYSKGLDVLSQSSATILCPLWGSIRIALHLALSYAEYYDKILAMYERIGDLLPRFRSYQAVFPTHPQVLAHLTDAYFEIVKFSYDASQVFKPPIDVTSKAFRLILKSRWKPLKMQSEQYLEKLRCTAKNVREAADIAHMEASRTHMLESKRFRDLVVADRSLQQYRDDVRRTKDFLSNYDYRVKHESIRSARCENTCVWFLESEKLLSWLKEGMEPFYCCGIPGSGKSVLASAIIDVVIENTLTNTDWPAIVCYHYCDYADGNTLDATKIVANLARQLLDNHPSCVSNILTRLRPAVENGFSISWSDAAYCLREALKTSKHTMFVIDGLDELDAANQDLVLAEMRHLIEEFGIALKVIFFGRRDEKVVRRYLSNASSLTISTDDNVADLMRYIEFRLQSCIDSGDLCLSNVDIANEIVENLVGGAEHMFLWVRLQIEELCAAEDETALRVVLRNLPQSLTDTYNRIVERISRQPRGNEMIDLARRVLSWIVCARRPLKVVEVQEAAALRIGDRALQQDRFVTNETLIFVACSNLIIVNAQGELRLAHHTVRDYLTRSFLDPKTDDGEIRWRIHLGDPTHKIARLCLDYLHFADFDQQIVLANNANFHITPSRLVPIIASSTGHAKKPLSTLLTIFKTDDKSKVSLRLPITSGQATERLQKQFHMLEYISHHWHWHLNQCWSYGDISEAWPDQMLNDGRNIIFTRETPFEFRPWSTGPLLEPNNHQWKQNFLLWALENNYTALFELCRKTNPAFLSPRLLRWRESSDRILDNGKFVASDGSVFIAGLILYACEAKAEATSYWLLRHLELQRARPSNTNPFQLKERCQILRNTNLKWFLELDAELHIFRGSRFTELEETLSALIRTEDMAAIETFIAYCHVKGHLRGLEPLTTSVRLNDATSLAHVCRSLMESLVPLEVVVNDWYSAVDLCINHRKENCLFSLHALHKVHSNAENETPLIKRLRQLSFTPSAYEKEKRKWLLAFFEFEPLVHSLLEPRFQHEPQAPSTDVPIREGHNSDWLVRSQHPLRRQARSLVQEDAEFSFRTLSEDR